MKVGDCVESGEFLRNLKKEHVVKRYAGDDDENPAYGFKLSKKHWKYADVQQGALSVNLRSCIRTERCSIALHPGGEDYFHVAIIDLGAINGSAVFPPLVAQYRPIEEIPNRCHFEIIPRDGTVLQWMEVAVWLDAPFPPAAKLPATAKEKRTAAAEYAKYRHYFNVRRWVRGKDGVLQ
ncbi:MAG: hypothetical protein ABR915_18910 [Thermoguttaceae bacterium]